MVGSQFLLRDNNHTLMRVQHDAYSELVGHLCGASRQRYLEAASLLQTDNDLSAKLQLMDSFDHRTLQSAHDRIAAYFRFLSPPLAQITLDETEEQYRRRLELHWLRFFYPELEDLNKIDDFTRAVCNAAADGNKEPGVAAERWLDRHLVNRYTAKGLVFRSPSDTLRLASLD